MSPEYVIDGHFSVKSDVFSFGVLLLEIVCGKKNRGFSHPDHHHNLLGHVSRKNAMVFTLSLSLNLSLLSTFFWVLWKTINMIFALGMAAVGTKQGLGINGCMFGRFMCCIAGITMHTSRFTMCSKPSSRQTSNVISDFHVG